MSGLTAAARAALDAWGGAARDPRPVALRENAVFDAELQGGRRVALRLHRPGYQDAAGIDAELDWTAALARGGFPLPEPAPTRAGGWWVQAGDRLATCVRWLDGAPIGEGGRPLRGDPVALMRETGALLARLHAATDALALPHDLPRQRWDAAGLLGEDPLWGRFWDTNATDAAGRALLVAARDAAALRLAALSGADFGLIHADVLRENLLRTPRGLALIDFDDSGWGWRMFDLGTAMVQNLDEPRAGAMAAALLDGYAALRPLPAAAADLTLFTALRAFASAGWILTRTAPDDPRRISHTDRALRMARAVVENRAAW